MLQKIPLIVSMMGASALAMYIPMVFAIHLQDWLIARAFFYHATFFLVFTSLIGIATYGRKSRNIARNHLATIFVTITFMPVFFAFPFAHLVPSLSFFQAYFEMLSSFTTTGATLFDLPEQLAAPLHLWRSLVGWLGGYLILVVAMAIFASMNLGGFEVYSTHTTTHSGQRINQRDTSTALVRYAAQIGPIYLFLTVFLTLALIISGQRTLVAACHAMAVLSTSGISPVGGLQGVQSGFGGELLMFLFLFFAVSRHAFLIGKSRNRVSDFKKDKEINLALFCVIGIPLLLFLRHWLAAFELSGQQEAPTALAAVWGSIFTVMSFLTTTGFESQAWGEARNWSGLGTPGLLFMGLAVMGGGIATTAGGVKLLRVYALYKHGHREMGRLSHPSSVGGSSTRARQIRREGAHVAWIFLMLFLMSIAAVMLAFSATGLGFIQSLTLAIAGLSTTGPLINMVDDLQVNYSSISDTAKLVFSFAMILGRLEALAVIALLNPDYWR